MVECVCVTRVKNKSQKTHVRIKAIESFSFSFFAVSAKRKDRHVIGFTRVPFLVRTCGRSSRLDFTGPICHFLRFLKHCKLLADGSHLMDSFTKRQFDL